MALVNGQSVGSVFGNPLKIRKVGTKFFIVQMYAVNPETFIVRGRAITATPYYVAPSTALTQADIDTIEASDGNGFNEPTTYATEEGFEKTVTADKSPAYVNSAQKLAVAQAAADSNGDGVADIARSAASFTKDPVAWVKENPLLSGVLAVAFYFLFKLVTATKKERKRALGF